MKRHICDICGGDLAVKTEAVVMSPFPIDAFVVRLFKVKNPFKFKEFVFFFDHNVKEHDLDVCSKCFDEFKEFMQRKNARFIQKEEQHGTDQH